MVVLYTHWDHVMDAKKKKKQNKKKKKKKKKKTVVAQDVAPGCTQCMCTYMCSYYCKKIKMAICSHLKKGLVSIPSTEIIPPSMLDYMTME